MSDSWHDGSAERGTDGPSGRIGIECRCIPVEDWEVGWEMRWGTVVELGLVAKVLASEWGSVQA